MEDYPEIMGMRLNMTFDEINYAVKRLGYDSVNAYLDTYTLTDSKTHFYVNSKFDESKIILEIHMQNSKVTHIIIKDWREFFNFTSDMKVENIVDIFRSYFLKDYVYRSILPLLRFYNNDWILAFNGDIIIMEKFIL